MPYQQGVSEYSSLSKPSGQVALVQTLFTPSFAENKAITWAKEIKGGVHPVKYLSHLLVDGLYDGIFSSRREEGLLAYVKFLDDDTPHHQYYKLKRMPGLAMSDWELILGTILTPSNPETVADLVGKDLIVQTANKFINVSDARTALEIANGISPYSRSFISDGNQWLRIYGVGEVDPSEVAANSAARHNKNNDSQLKDSLGNAITADQLISHIIDSTKHREINDINEGGATNELWSSKKVSDKLQEGISNLIDLAPAALNTLRELSQAIGNDPNFAATFLNYLSQKFDKSGGPIGDDENGYIFSLINRAVQNFKSENEFSRISFLENTFRLDIVSEAVPELFAYLQATENDFWLRFENIILDGFVSASQLITNSVESNSYKSIVQGLIPNFTSVIYWEAQLGQVAKVILRSNCFLQKVLLPNNTENSEYTLIVYQDNVGGRSLSYAPGYKFPTGIPAPINLGPNQFTILKFFYDGTDFIYIGSKPEEIHDSKILYVDPLFGNNITAKKGHTNYKYKTIGFALSSSVAGDTIELFPGNYDEINLSLKSGVNIFFHEGATIIPTDQKKAILTDNGGAVVCSLTGRGIIKNQGTAGNDTNALVVGKTGSKIYIDLIELSSLEVWALGGSIEVVNTMITVEASIYNGGSAVFRNCFFNESIQYFRAGIGTGTPIGAGNTVKCYSCRFKNTIAFPADIGVGQGAMALAGIANVYHISENANDLLIRNGLSPNLIFKKCDFYSIGHNIAVNPRRPIGGTSITTFVIDDCRFFSSDTTKFSVFFNNNIGFPGEPVPVNFKVINSIGNTDTGGNLPIDNKITTLPGYIKEPLIENYI